MQRIVMPSETMWCMFVVGVFLLSGFSRFNLGNKVLNSYDEIWQYTERRLPVWRLGDNKLLCFVERERERTREMTDFICEDRSYSLHRVSSTVDRP